MGNPIVNLDQSEAWNGYEGRHWATYPERYDALNDAVNDHLLDDLPVVAGSRVLDVGCGTGRVARLAGGRGATVLGVDLSEPMLREAVAAAEREGLGGVAFARGDAQVHPYPREGFDAVVSRFGVMFFADPVAAFANLRRALRPGGRLAFVCSRGHRSMDQTKIYRAIGTVVSVPDFTGYTGPASFGDPAYTERILTGAGFAEVTSTAVDVPQVWGRDAEDAADFLMGWGPVQHWLREDEADETARSRARDAALEAFRGFTTADGDVVLTARLWLVTAERP
ncbi:class I SAM-dependent methyltransferase [Actinacidiphila glaucinigra]|uniref:class I SAM-dependent methyltransferase n=1 Tax=Actinacidiphila glaucinigra TaxID=235986 RepID=UPI002DDA6E11|nr:class I SAM-dependent methyltransferase [Actinacidiphila glaucinigra]WSD61410.1 class I SAM-dependent methyltransferase [Actinacidiphila glaucinigra]